METTHSYKKIVYRIRHKERTNFGLYEGNLSIGTFEFLTKENAKRYIKEQKLKDVNIEEVIISTTESMRTL